MRLDIGAAEGPDLNATHHLDISSPCEAYADGVVYENYIVADAHVLPFKDNTFDEVFSGQCLGLLTDSPSIHEAMRVLKLGGKLTIRIQMIALPDLIRDLLDWQIMILEANNRMVSEEILDVIIETIKIPSIEWPYWRETGNYR